VHQCFSEVPQAPLLARAGLESRQPPNDRVAVERGPPLRGRGFRQLFLISPLTPRLHRVTPVTPCIFYTCAILRKCPPAGRRSSEGQALVLQLQHNVTLSGMSSGMKTPDVNRGHRSRFLWRPLFVAVAIMALVAPIAQGELGHSIGTKPDRTTKGVAANDVLNLMAFGASGSRATMSCTATSGSPVLTHCSGGDFIVGSYVRIGSAGISSSLSAPGSPTLTANSGEIGGSSSSIAQIGSCSPAPTPTLLTLTNPVFVEAGQNITVSGAGTSGADLITTVAIKASNSRNIYLASSCLTSVNGASVTLGTVTYGYKVLAVDGAPNGALTAAGPAQTISQTAQTPLASANATWPWENTTVTWAADAGASIYIVYKSINGGPYNFYTGETGTSFTDYGTSQTSGFSCSDYGFPCTAPTAATPNDVFAQISAASSGSFTLSALPYPPKYVSPVVGHGGTYPSLPSVTATVTVYHDDTPAFQKIYQYLYALPNPGHATIEIPPGDYNVYSADPYGVGTVFSVLALTDVTLEGDGWASKLHQIGGRSYDTYDDFIRSFGGANGPSSSHSAARVAKGYGSPNPSYALLDPATAGSLTVTLANVANVSNFSPGQYVVIWSGDGSYPGDTYQTLTKVASVDAASGILYLRDPLIHTYSASLPQPYNEYTHAAGPPQITPMPYGLMTSNLILRDFWYEGPTRFLNMDSYEGLTVSGLYVHGNAFHESGLASDIKIIGNTIIEDGSDVSSAAGPVTGAAASHSILVANNSYFGRGNVHWQNCQEGSSDVVWTNNVLRVAGYANSSMPLFTTSTCFRWSVSANEVLISDSNFATIFGWSNPGPWIFSAKDNTIYVDNIQGTPAGGVGVLAPIQTSSISDPSLVSITLNTWQIDNDDGAGPRVFGTAGGVDAPNSVLAASATSGTVNVYSLMGNATIIQVGPLTGNIVQVNIGSQRFAGLHFALDFVQATSGGPYSLPNGIGQAQWNTGGNDVDFKGSIPPLLNQAPGSNTIIWFYDDGITVHELSRSYNGTQWANIIGTSGNAQVGIAFLGGGPNASSGGEKLLWGHLTGYAQTGSAQTYSIPFPFITNSPLEVGFSGCGTYNPTINSNTLTLPANALMTAETCDFFALGQ
jgi:hypothetical protein